MKLEKLLIPGEDPAQLHQLTASLTDSWHPAGFKEEIFVHQLIHHTWQIERLRTVESQTWAKAAAAGPANVAGIERCISRATTDLRRLQEARVRQASRPVESPSPKQTQFEMEIASWPKPEPEEQSTSISYRSHAPPRRLEKPNEEKWPFDRSSLTCRRSLSTFVTK